jgi:hypothetical protein
MKQGMPNMILNVVHICCIEYPQMISICQIHGSMKRFGIPVGEPKPSQKIIICQNITINNTCSPAFKYCTRSTNKAITIQNTNFGHVMRNTHKDILYDTRTSHHCPNMVENIKHFLTWCPEYNET